MARLQQQLAVLLALVACAQRGEAQAPAPASNYTQLNGRIEFQLAAPELQGPRSTWVVQMQQAARGKMSAQVRECDQRNIYDPPLAPHCLAGCVTR